MQRTGGNVDDTNDLLQETFVKVYLNLQRYSSRFTFGQWVYTIARNTFIDYTRRRRDDTVSIDYVGEGIGVSGSLGGPTPEEHLITHQSQVQLEGLLAKMSPRYRELIELRFFREFSYEEIAAKTLAPDGNGQNPDTPGPRTVVPIHHRKQRITFGDSISPMILINAASQSLSVLLKKRFTTFSK